MDPIDRQAAIDAAKNWFEVNLYYHPHSKSKSIPANELYDILNSMPTIEAEPIIRCKDCENFTPGKDEWGNCCENPMKMWRETDFCSWAERRDDE